MLLSATVIALNEEARLGDCLASLAFCDEVMVVDGGSTDRTRALAEAAGARVLVRPFDDFARQHEFARTQARGRWVLSLDADERASPELQAAARRIATESAVSSLATENVVSAYSLPFKNHFRGAWLRHGGLWPDRHVRLFLREACSYDPARPVHEKLRVPGRVAALETPVLHHPWTSLAQCLAKSERYAEAAALALHAQGRSAGAAKMLASPAWRFFRAYVLRLGFLDGAAGALVAYARAYETYARYARLWELSRFPAAAQDKLR